MDVPAQIEPSEPDIAGLSDSLFHEVASVCDTADQAFAVVRAVIDRVAAYYSARAVI